MSHYVGLDISMKETSIAILNAQGKLIFETVCETEPEIIGNELKKTGLSFEKIGLESGCLSFWLVEELEKLSIQAICIESKQMATFLALKLNKTDKNDARLIAEAMRCNLYKEVHLKTKTSININLQMGSRRTLIDIRTKLKNSIRGFIKAYGIRLEAVSHAKFPEIIRKRIVSCDDGVKIAIETLLTSFEEVCKNVDILEKELEKLAKTDPVIQIFESIPGVGPITSLTYKAVIDNPHRFKDPRSVGAYLGLTPTQYSSGETVKQGRISKCGCSELRSLLVECAITILTRTTKWSKLKAWGLRIMKRSGIKKAASAVARKLAIIMLRMWQENKAFISGEVIIPKTERKQWKLKLKEEVVCAAV